ncbi:response regulator transcription factor [Mesorhizobium sp. CA8]|uniref:response regulator transcription factor n=1 Tax=unclassified Mesorhizobium TaxID=325217 RepID=UPI001CCBBD08|nr:MULTISPECIES: response regulator transcription factor [unclassified Mesorhizobium]MBZ9765029.1 response regulator transcription factor [Mesorhizobium sp. CA8]MBZ9823512.1 response regulator transcription factor [Mesorhizobium sp. CA4]
MHGGPVKKPPWPKRVLIAERNQLVISALRDIISRDERFDFIAGIHSGTAFLKALEETQTAFDVAILGWKLSDMNAGELLIELRRRQFATRVVIFSEDHDMGILKQCVRLGAHGFCYQFDGPGILFDTVAAVANGRICVPSIDISKINETPLSRLTTRERELLAVLANGWTNQEIAAKTGISENTVKYHLRNLYDKLRVSNRAMAVALFFTDTTH